MKKYLFGIAKSLILATILSLAGIFIIGIAILRGPKKFCSYTTMNSRQALLFQRSINKFVNKWS